MTHPVTYPFYHFNRENSLFCEKIEEKMPDVTLAIRVQYHVIILTPAC